MAIDLYTGREEPPLPPLRRCHLYDVEVRRAGAELCPNGQWKQTIKIEAANRTAAGAQARKKGWIVCSVNMIA